MTHSQSHWVKVTKAHLEGQHISWVKVTHSTSRVKVTQSTSRVKMTQQSQWVKMTQSKPRVKVTQSKSRGSKCPKAHLSGSK